jgi:HD superfamily phosphohydrolase
MTSSLETLLDQMESCWREGSSPLLFLGAGAGVSPSFEPEERLPDGQQLLAQILDHHSRGDGATCDCTTDVTCNWAPDFARDFASGIQRYADYLGLDPAQVATHPDMALGVLASEGAEGWRAGLSRALEGKPVPPGYRILARLAARKMAQVIFTTNLDEALESAFQLEKVPFVGLVSGQDYADFEYLYDRGVPLICKLHGTVSLPSSIPLSPDSLGELEAGRRDALLETLRSSPLVLIVGYGARDPDVLPALQGMDVERAWRVSLGEPSGGLSDAFQRESRLISSVGAEDLFVAMARRFRIPGREVLPEERAACSLTGGNRPFYFVDPVFGRIDFPGISERVFQVIASGDMQRLRGVQQLSLVDLEYPGAVHSRFNHALGVAHLVRLGLDHIRSIDDGCAALVSPRDYVETIIAALLHDIGHGPFGHVMDTFFERIGEHAHNHETYTTDRIRGEIVAYGLPEILEGLELDVETIASRAAGAFPDQKCFLSQLIAHYGLDFDRIEYLARDSHFSGIGPRGFNYAVIVNAVVPVQGRRISPSTRESHHLEQDCYYLAYDERAVEHSIEPLLLARHLMYRQVYEGEINRAAQLMIAKALEALYRWGEVDPNELMGWTDWELWSYYMGSINPLARHMALRVKYGRLYGCVDALAAGEDERALVGLVQRIKSSGRIDAFEDDLLQALRSYEIPVGRDTVLVDAPRARRPELLLVTRTDRCGRAVGGVRDVTEAREMSARLSGEGRASRPVRLYCPPEWPEEIVSSAFREVLARWEEDFE